MTSDDSARLERIFTQIGRKSGLIASARQSHLVFCKSPRLTNPNFPGVSGVKNELIGTTGFSVSVTIVETNGQRLFSITLPGRQSVRLR